MGILLNHHIEEGEDRAGSRPECTLFSKALSQLGVPFEISDHTVRIGEFRQRNRQAAIDLREAFEAESNGSKRGARLAPIARPKIAGPRG